MPRLNRPGQAVSGVGDGIVSIDGLPVARGGKACWLDDDRVVFAGPYEGRWQTLAYDQRNGRLEPLADNAPDFVCAGGGSWASQGAGGLYSSLRLPEWAILALASTDGRSVAAPDGAIATTAPSGLGFVLTAPDGRHGPLHAAGHPAYHLTATAADAAIWPSNGRLHTVGLQLPAHLDGAAGRAIPVVLDGRAWLVQYIATLGLVVRDYYDTMGLVVEARPVFFHYDAGVASEGRVLRIVYSTSPGEAPLELVVKDYTTADLWRQAVDLARVLTDPQKPPPVEPDEPEPEPMTYTYKHYEHAIRERWNELGIPEQTREVQAAHGGITQDEINRLWKQGGHHRERAEAIMATFRFQTVAFHRILGELHYLHGNADLGAGRKTGGNRHEDRATDIVVLKPFDPSGRMIDTGPVQQVDAVYAIDGPDARIVWDVIDFNPERSWTEPIRPDGHVDPVDPGGDNRPPPTDPALPAVILARLGELEARMLKYGDRIGLRTSGGHLICAEGGGSGEVNATRDRLGEWETFTVEKPA